MKYFLGVVPPPATSEKVLNFQKSFPSNKVPYFHEPHITLKKVPLGMFEDKTWLTRIMVLAGSHPRFKISLQGLGSFDNQVLFLDPGRPEGLIDLHNKLVALFDSAIETEQRFLEGPLYHPHLTLGETTWGGMSEGELEAMRRKAEFEFYSIPPFQVDFVRIYEKEKDGDPYHKLIDIPLKI